MWERAFGGAGAEAPERLWLVSQWEVIEARASLDDGREGWTRDHCVESPGRHALGIGSEGEGG